MTSLSVNKLYMNSSVESMVVRLTEGLNGVVAFTVIG